MFLVGYTKNDCNYRLVRMLSKLAKFATAASKILPGLILFILVLGFPLTSQAQSVGTEGDGSSDPTFTSPYPYSNDYISHIAVQADTKMLSVTAHRGSSLVCWQEDVLTCLDCPYTDYNLTRLNVNGSFDSSFSSIFFGTNNFIPQDLVVQSDGKILISGRYQYIWGPYCSAGSGGLMRRYNADGSLDTTFNNGTPGDINDGRIDRSVNKIVLQSDGKILVAGDFSRFRGTACKGLARLNPDGTIDPTFNCTSSPNGSITSLLLQNDGKILIAGGNANQSFITRLNSDGSLDNSFKSNFDGNSNYANISAIALQNDSKILVTGVTNANSPQPVISYLVRLNSDGSIDKLLSNTSGWGLAIQTNGKILLVGASLARLNPDGSPDSSFKFSPSGSNVTINTMLLQKDGKILVGGKFSTAAGYGLVRLGNKPRFNTATSLASSANLVTYGQSVTLTATVSSSVSGIPAPSGTVTFNIPGFTSVLANVSGGIATYTTNNLPAGSYTVTASYSGDTNYQPSVSTSPINLVVERIQTTTSLVSSASVATYGQSVELTATVGSSATSNVLAPGGTVTFDIPGVGSVGATLSSGVATYFTSTLPAGNYSITATYSGDSRYKPSTSITNLVVEKAISRVSLTSSANPAVVSRTLTFTTLVAPLPASASGTVSFTFSYSDGTSFTSDPVTVTTGGIASFVTETLTAAGSYTVTASYSGDANHLAGESPAYTQYIVSGCDPLVVTASSDDGTATTCGSFSYALAQTIAGTISFELTNSGGSRASTLSFSGGITPTLRPGVSIDGGASGIILDGGGISGDGLQLGGSNQLINLTLRGFGGRELLLAPGASSNHFYRVKIES